MFERITNFPFLNLIKNKSFQNFIFLSVIQASNILITLISMPLLITAIGVDQFGLVSLALSVIIIANIFVSFGFNLSGPREIAINQENRKKLSFLISNIIGGKLILACVITLVLIIAVFGLDLFKEYQNILLFSLLLLFSEATLPLWFFQGLEKMKLISIANIFSKLLYLLGIVLFINSPEQSQYVNFLMGGSALFINLLVLYYIRVELNIVFFRPKLKQLYHSLRSNLHFFLSNLTSYLSLNGGLVILSFFSTPEVLGFYSLAEKITMVTRLFPALVVQSIYPNATKLFNSNQEAFIRFVRKTYFWSLLATFGLSIFTYFLSPIIIQLLAKSRLEDSITYLKLLSFIPFFACLNIINVLILLISNQQNKVFKISLFVCLYMVGVGTWMASIYGAAGICITLLSTEIVYFLIYSVIIHRYHRRFFYEVFNFKKL